MRKPVFNLALVLVMVLALSPASLVLATGPDQPVVFSDRKAPAHLQEVPSEVKALFEGGMSAEEFVDLAGYVPHALEGVVEGEALMIIELEGEPLSVVYAERKAGELSTSSASLDAYRDGLLNAQAVLESTLSGMGVTVISHYTAAYNGMQALVPYSKLNEIRALPGVKAVHRAPIHQPALGASVPLIGAADVQEYAGIAGEGVTIAVIDTGIDYTHAVFGGPGEELAYSLNDPNVIEFNTFPTAKVIDGYDFAGTDYDAGGSGAALIPMPDPDPLDENGHGTHVSSIAAGIMAGQVMTGVAPAANLIALKVFGADGSTSLTMDALDWATLRYIYTGAPQVINMSLGSSFGIADLNDPDIMATKNAVDTGIVVVASSGNSGDVSYVTGSPAAADGAISVAASTTGWATGPTVNVFGTSYVTQTNILYTPDAFTGGGDFTTAVTAPLGWAGSLPGTDAQLCTIAGVAPGALAGKIALISRGTCAFSAKVDNAAALGAVAALIYNNAAGIITMAGEPVSNIPAGSLQMGDGLNLIPANGQTVVVSAEHDVTTVQDPYTPADTIASFSSRGPRGIDSFLKPEVTAPGVAIFAAAAGSGTRGMSMNGTSMAAPHVAGVAALMVEAHPDWTPEQIKAAIMNTAAEMEDDASIPLSGAGRVDAARAVHTEVTAVGDADLVSLNWGVVTLDDATTVLTKTVTLHNYGSSTETYHADWMFQGDSFGWGVDIDILPPSAPIAPGGSVTFDVVLTLDATQIPTSFDALAEEYYGYVVFDTPVIAAMGMDKMPEVLKVPFYFQPRPYATLMAVGDTTIAPSTTDLGSVAISHSGTITSSTWMYPALAWNETPDPDMAGPGDVRIFGMDYGGSSPNGDIVVVAVDAWDAWHVPQPYFAEFDLYLDVDEDGVPDIVNFNYDYGSLGGGDATNVWVVAQVDLATGEVFLGSPYTIFTDYNASFMEYYLPAPWQYLDADTNPDFDYELYGFDLGGSMLGAAGSFDFVKYPLNWMILSDPGPADPATLALFAINDVDGYELSQPEGLMLVDYNGDPYNVDGGQAYFLPLRTEWPFQVYLPVIQRAPTD